MYTKNLRAKKMVDRGSVVEPAFGTRDVTRLLPFVGLLCIYCIGFSSPWEKLNCTVVIGRTNISY